jgi:hypothetical protein
VNKKLLAIVLLLKSVAQWENTVQAANRFFLKNFISNVVPFQGFLFEIVVPRVRKVATVCFFL